MKDRATALAIAAAAEEGASTLAAASTGNAASSLACLCAASGLSAVVFLPENTPPPKIAQTLIHGARLFPVKGTYDEAFALCASACHRFGWISRNTATHPFLGEGKKTAALEVAEQLGWDVPDRMFIPVGDGCIFQGVAKGFQDLHEAGWTARVPTLIGVQSEGSDALKRAFEAGRNVPEPVVPRTFADSIAVGLPRDGVKALRAAKTTRGRFLSVPDPALHEAMALLARKTGVFAEPAGAAPLAGALAMAREGTLARDDRIVLLVTGTGFKDIDAARQASGPLPPAIPPDMEVLEKRMKDEAIP
jgi:threonine synthase